MHLILISLRLVSFKIFLKWFFQGLSDESEFVRETSLKAGQRIVNQYASTAIEVFLPQLEDGLLNDNWRIRMSSVQLMGDLLYKISGVTGKMTTEGEEDDNFGTTYSNKVGKNVCCVNFKVHYNIFILDMTIIIFNFLFSEKMRLFCLSKI